jgi:rhamnogalacturonan endolyase
MNQRKRPIRQTPVNAPVTVTDNGGAWTLDNGIVKATINKRNGRMTSLVYHGINTMGGGGYWEQTPPARTSALTIDPAKNGGERAEVAVKGAPRPGH